MAEQRRQPVMGQQPSKFWEDIVKSIPLSNGLAALLMAGLQEVFNHITDCPCNYGDWFGCLTLVGPIAILIVSFAIPILIESCIARRDPDKGKRRACYGALTFVASVAWLSVALLNSEAVCCIQGGFPSDSPCLVERNAADNAVLYGKCISDSRLAGALMMTLGGISSSIALAIIHAKYGHLEYNVDNGENGDVQVNMLPRARIDA